jgi:hypothetical protein
MGYNLDAIRKKVNQLSQSDKRKNEESVKLQYWKPEMGENVVRFLPYDDGNGQPFQEVGFYNSPQLSERRVVAPYQFGLEDPVNDLMTELRKERQADDVWNIMKQLKVRGSFYAPILVRGEEDKGVQVWEMSQKVVQSIYEILVNEDYEEENLFDVHEGFDFSITARDSGKKFNGYVVKDLTIVPKRKPSPALKTKKACDELVASVPNVGEVFENYCMGADKLRTLLDNMLNPDEGDEEGTEVTAEREKTEEVSNATSKIDNAFADL